MSDGNSRSVSSNQQGVYEHLSSVVSKHLQHPFLKPIASHTQRVFDELHNLVSQQPMPLVLDSCCGVGESSSVLAERHPDCWVIGVDKSAYRVDKQQHHIRQSPNLRIVQADLHDLWRLMQQANWRLSHHYLLYPNPWPKAKHFQRRWHGGPTFSNLIALGGQLEVRSNWSVYIDEFAQALHIAGVNSTQGLYQAPQAMTPFERKYWASGQQSYRLLANLG